MLCLFNRTVSFMIIFVAAKSVFVELQSSDTKASIRVNGKDYSKDDRGFNIVILDYTTGDIQASESFNTQSDGGSAKAMANFINSLKPATIILVATRGNADVDMNDDAYDALVSLLNPLGFRFQSCIVMLREIAEAVVKTRN